MSLLYSSYMWGELDEPIDSSYMRGELDEPIVL